MDPSDRSGVKTRSTRPRVRALRKPGLQMCGLAFPHAIALIECSSTAAKLIAITPTCRHPDLPSPRLTRATDDYHHSRLRLPADFHSRRSAAQRRGRRKRNTTRPSARLPSDSPHVASRSHCLGVGSHRHLPGSPRIRSQRQTGRGKPGHLLQTNNGRRHRREWPGNWDTRSLPSSATIVAHWLPSERGWIIRM